MVLPCQSLWTSQRPPCAPYFLRTLWCSSTGPSVSSPFPRHPGRRMGRERTQTPPAARTFAARHTDLDRARSSRRNAPFKSNCALVVCGVGQADHPSPFSSCLCTGTVVSTAPPSRPMQSVQELRANLATYKSQADQVGIRCVLRHGGMFVAFPGCVLVTGV
jgi:hypothetical protein